MRSKKIQIRSIFGIVLFEHEKTNNTIRDTLEEAIQQNISLDGANLIYTNLSLAEKLNKQYIRIGYLGNNKQVITYCLDDDIIWWHDFVGTLTEFEAEIHNFFVKDLSSYQEYVKAVDYIKSYENREVKKI